MKKFCFTLFIQFSFLFTFSQSMRIDSAYYWYETTGWQQEVEHYYFSYDANNLNDSIVAFYRDSTNWVHYGFTKNYYTLGRKDSSVFWLDTTIYSRSYFVYNGSYIDSSIGYIFGGDVGITKYYYDTFKRLVKTTSSLASTNWNNFQDDFYTYIGNTDIVDSISGYFYQPHYHEVYRMRFFYSDFPLSIPKNFQKADVLVYPNPSNGNFVIRNLHGIDDIEILNGIGQRILYRKTQNEEEVINLELNSSGIYFIRFNSGAATSFRKIVVE